MTREEFRAWKEEQLEIQGERVKLLMQRMEKSAKLEERLENLMTAMGPDYEWHLYDSGVDDSDDDDDEQEGWPKVPGGSGEQPTVISMYKMKMLEERTQKLIWLKKKMTDVQVKAEARAAKEKARLAEEAEQAGLEMEPEEPEEQPDGEAEGLATEVLLDMKTAMSARKKRDEEQAEIDRLAAMSRFDRMVNTLKTRGIRGSLVSLAGGGKNSNYVPQ